MWEEDLEEGENVFDAQINTDYLDKYQAQTDLADTLAGGAQAAVVDFGASVWNSMPGTEEVDTYDLLQRINPNAAQVYAEHPEVIQTVSMVGGVFAPAGLALKGMKWLRSGAKGADWFSDAGKAKRMSELDNLYQAGPAKAKAYRELKLQNIGNRVGNEVLDAAVMEVAILGTMSAHPFMADYLENPVKNFGIGLALGGVIGGGVGVIADRAAVRALEGSANAKVWEKIGEKFKPTPEGLPYVNQLQTQQENIEILEAMSRNSQESGLLKDVASNVLAAVKAEQQITFTALGKNLTEGMGDAGARRFLDSLTKDTRFQGVEGIDFMKVPTDGYVTGQKALQKLGTSEYNVFEDFYNSKGKITARAYSPEFDLFGSANEIAKISRASALGTTTKSLRAGNADAVRYIRSPDHDAAFDLLSRRAPEVDNLYLTRLSHIDSLKPEALAKASVASDDLFTLNALVARAVKNTDAFTGIKIKIVKESPDFNGLAQRVLKTSGMAANHLKKLQDVTTTQSMQALDMLGQKSSLGPETRQLLKEWQRGAGAGTLRNSVAAFFQGGDTAMSQPAAAMYNSAESVTLRSKFAELADFEGNVYLWKEMKRNPRSQSPLESYTTDLGKAAEFGNPKLYKVRVQDILGGVAGPKSPDGVARNEILVGAPARQVETTLPSSEVIGASGLNVPLLSNTIEEMSIGQISGLLLDKKEAVMTSMLKQGVPFEIMSVRTNTPIDTVKAWAAFGGSKRLFELEAEGFATASYSNADNIAEYLSKETAPLKLKINKSKVPYAELSASLDRKALDMANREIVHDIMLLSPSQTVQQIRKYFFDPEKSQILDILRSQVNKAVSGLSGSKFFQSTDFFTRNMGDFGKIATVVGKDVQHIANQTIQELVGPLTTSMSRIVKDPLALLEANHALAVNAKLSGWRTYKDRQFWQKTKQLDPATGKEIEVLTPVTPEGQVFKVVSNELDQLLTNFEVVGGDLFAMKNAANAIQGIPPMNSLGFWVPSFNPKSKHIAYVHTSEDKTSILWGNTEEQLADAVQTFKTSRASAIASGEIRVIENKGQQELYNQFAGRLDQINMDIANIEMKHGGSSAPAIVKANADIFGDVAHGYEHYIQGSVRNLAELSMSDITDQLRRMSQIDQLALKNQPLSAVQKFVGQRQDTAAIMRNTLLGVSNLKDNSSWMALNQSFETVLGIVGKQADDLWKKVTSPIKRNKAGEIDAEELAKMDYEKLAADMESIGMRNPFAAFDEEAARVFGLAKITESKNSSKRAIFASNALAATITLRFGEIAQPVVNAMSLPILTMSAMADRLPPHFMGAAKGTAKASAAQLMYEGTRAAFSKTPQHLEWARKWEEAGYFTPMVSEASKVLKLAREFEPGAISSVEKALDSNLVKWMSWTADSSEEMVRRIAMFTGGNMAKRMYPELTDTGITIFAREFMDRVIGNYSASQRPTMFQGTLGTAMGLFQTYMVSMAQSTYKHLELKNYKAIGKTMLTQAGIFGTSSLPGFNPVSQMIGEHFSDNNVDLITGTYRALPDTAANLLIYGVPSNLGPAFYSRGELSPRIPAGVGEFPAVNIVGQALEGLIGVAKAVGQQDEGAGQAIMQALSMQSVSRPIARLSELASGYSVTRQGNTIAAPAEVWSPIGVFARLMSTRPMDEAKLRDAIHLNTLYGSLDREARQKVIARLKTAIRSNSLTDEMLAEYAEEYMRTGSATGWRSAVNTAVAQTEFSGKAPLQAKMRMNNPLHYMIDSLDGME